MARPPDDVMRRLYEAPPDGFVAVRDEAVAAARAAGDRDTAKAIAALRKPTVAAWLVNLLALRRPELLDELVELAAALRSAQRELQGDELRELSVQRRKAVSALVAQARKLAVEADRSMAAKLPLAEVEGTLTAALADADVAEQVRSGRLVRAVEYAGFGEVPRPKLRLITGGDQDGGDQDGGDQDGGDRDDDRSGGGWPGAAASEQARRRDRRAAEAQRAAAAQRRALDRELANARSAADEAAAGVDRAEAAEHDADAALDEIEAALIELERRRAAAQADLSTAKLARRAAIREVALARRRLGEVQAALDELDDDPSRRGGSG